MITRLCFFLQSALVSSIAFANVYSDRSQQPDEAMTCFRTLASRSKARPITFAVLPVEDQTGMFGIEGSPPMKLTMVLKHALASIHPRYTVMYADTLAEMRSSVARLVTVEAAVVAADINDRDRRRGREGSLVVGKGNGLVSGEARGERWGGSFSGTLMAVGYEQSETRNMTTLPELTSEISFSAVRSQNSKEWALSFGPLVFGSSDVDRVNGSPHAFYGKAAEMLAIRLVGKASSLPYWRCTRLPVDETVITDIKNHIRGLPEANREALQAELLALHDYSSYEFNAAQMDAVRNGCGPCGQDPVEMLTYLEVNKPLAPGDASLHGNVVPEPPRVSYNYATRGPTQSTLPQASAIVLTGRVEPEYPLRALRARREAVVQLSVDIDRNGYVVDARVTNNASREFAKAALKAVKQYTFSPDYNGEAIRRKTQTISFRIDPDDRY